MIKKSELRLSKLPQQVGVYYFRDSFAQVIYIGKAKSLRKRLQSYFRLSAKRMANPKLRSLINSIEEIDFILVKNEQEALVLEDKLIKKYQPKYNITLRDDKRFFLIKIDLENPFPFPKLVRFKRRDKAKYFGPFSSGINLKETVDFLIKHFKLRSCEVLNPTEKDKKHCHDHIIRFCSSPCDKSINVEDYREKIEALIRTLQGNNKELIKELEEKMLFASEELKFERAALYRNIIQNIKDTFYSRIKQFEYAKITSTENDQEILGEMQELLSLASKPVIIECIDNSHLQGTFTVSSVVRFTNAKPDTANYRHYRIKTVEGIDDFSSMYEVVYRHYKRIKEQAGELPNLIIVDGGLGQLSYAQRAMAELDLNHLPLFSLAKREETLYSINFPRGLNLRETSPVHKLLRYVRDESHRFAIEFNRQLRKKKIMESVLDEIPQVGKSRKMALLQALGSVQAIKKKSAQEIAKKVPSISVRLAENILRFLKKF